MSRPEDHPNLLSHKATLKTALSTQGTSDHVLTMNNRGSTLTPEKPEFFFGVPLMDTGMDSDRDLHIVDNLSNRRERVEDQAHCAHSAVGEPQ